jgi:hypothetical protein
MEVHGGCSARGMRHIKIVIEVWPELFVIEQSIHAQGSLSFLNYEEILTAKKEIIARLESQLEFAQEIRAKLEADSKALERRAALRAWQAARLARTHADLLENPRYRDTALFFLSDIYGPKDLNRHINAVKQLVPLMTKVLPDAGLETVADAVELNAVSEWLDADMVEILKDDVFHLDEANYIRAYRAVGRKADRERQIGLIEHVGRSLDSLTRKPLISATLSLMRKPAKLAGVGELHDFLERGHSAFRIMQGAKEFLETITSQERALMTAWFAGP